MEYLASKTPSKEVFGFALKFAFCALFYFGISEELGIGLGAAPVVVLGALAVYWKFIRHRFV